jgi:hypothetical protein
MTARIRLGALVSALAILVAATAGAPPADAQTPLVVGEPFPDFTARDHLDAEFQLSSHLGKVVLLHVCAMWCGPCQASATFEADLTAALDEQIGAASWLLVDVLYQDQFQAPTDTIDANNWRNALDTPALTLHGEGGPALGEFVATLLGPAIVVPTYFVVAPDGTLGAVVVGFDGNNQPLVDAVAGVWAAQADAAPPVIAGKKDVVVETKLAPVQVRYANPTAVDAVDGTVAVSCQPRSGSLFPFGTTPVTCAASDTAGNTAHAAFRVIVRTPTTAGAVSPPGNPRKAFTHVGPGQRVRVTAGGFAPGAFVLLSFSTAELTSIALGGTTADSDGRIDVRLKIPKRIPAGPSQVTAASQDPDGTEFIRAWLVTVKR